MPDTDLEPLIEPFGDGAVLVTLGRRVDPDLAARAQELAARLDELAVTRPGLRRAVPAHASVLVPFDPLVVSLEDVFALARSTIARASAGAPATASSSTIDIPVRYGGADGPDLDEVAERGGLRPADVVELHAGATYRVLFLGFAPGFAYLGGLPPALELSRRTTPRERVPAGSVAIAGLQTAVYPRALPGGWHLIGRTETVLFDPLADPPSRFQPGATVRFVPIRARP